MEVEEEQIKDLSNSDKDILRISNNVKIGIFQNKNSYCYRQQKDVVPFENSNEFSHIQNRAAHTLLSGSHFCYYSKINSFGSYGKIKNKLRTLITNPNQNLIGKDTQEMIHDKTNQIKLALMREKLKENSNYIHLNSLIEQPNFKESLKSNKVLTSFVISHPYFGYHPKHDEIMKYLNEYVFPAGGTLTEVEH